MTKCVFAIILRNRRSVLLYFYYLFTKSVVFSRVLFAVLIHRDVFGRLGGCLVLAWLPGLTAWLDGWMAAWLDA